MRNKQIDIKGVFYYLTIIILIFAAKIWAEDSKLAHPTQNDLQNSADTASDERPIGTLDYLQLEASSLLADTAHWIDSRFEDGGSLTEENKSWGTIKLSAGYSRYDQLEVKPRLNARMNLPRLHRRANLLLDGSDSSDFNVEQNPLSNRRSNDDDEKGQWRLALRYFLKERDNFKISLSGGLSWGYLYGGVKLRANQEYRKWHGCFTNRLRYYTDDGWENRATYDLQRRISEDYSFLSTTGIELFESEDGIPHYQRLGLFQVLDSKRAMIYETALFFDTKPSHQVTDVQIILKYRQRFLRDWLVFEVSPRVAFPREYHRKVNPGIVLTFLATFGYDAGKQGHKKIFSH